MKSKFLLLILVVSNLVYAQPDTLWSKIYPSGKCKKGVRCSDGGFLIGGSSYTIEFREDYYAVKADSDGNLQWSATTRSQYHDNCNSVCEVIDGKFLMIGRWARPNSGGVVLLDQNGDSLDTWFYGGEGCDLFCGIKTSDGHAVIGGNSSEFAVNGSWDAYLAKIDTCGEIVWQNVYGSGSGDDLWCVQETSDSGFICGGLSGSYNEGYQYYVVKTDSTGDEEWSSVYYEQISSNVLAIVETENGYAFAGYPISNHVDGIPGFVLVNIDAEGNETWRNYYGGRGTDIPWEILYFGDGGFLMGGSTTSFGGILDEVYLVRTDSEGEQLWDLVFTIGQLAHDECYSIIPNEDGSYSIIGTTTIRRTGDCYFLARTTPDPVTVPYLLDPVYPTEIVLHSPYPNPFNSTTMITWSLPRPEQVTVTIFDQMGRRISTLLDQQQSPGSHSIGWQSEGLSAGVYLCRVVAGGTAEVREMVMMR